VSKEVGEEERGTGGCVDRRSDAATAVHVEILSAAALTAVDQPCCSLR